MPALLPIILTVSHVVLAADTVPKFDVERTCRPAAAVGLPGRTVAACQRDENEARTKLEQEWTRYNVELLTCLEIAKQAAELPKESKAGTVGWR